MASNIFRSWFEIVSLKVGDILNKRGLLMLKGLLLNLGFLSITRCIVMLKQPSPSTKPIILSSEINRHQLLRTPVFVGLLGKTRILVFKALWMARVSGDFRKRGKILFNLETVKLSMLDKVVKEKFWVLCLLVIALLASGCVQQPTGNGNGGNGNGEERFCSPESRNADACALIFEPVCGWFDGTKIQCIKYPCAGNYSNSCLACMDKRVLYWTEGDCPE